MCTGEGFCSVDGGKIHYHYQDGDQLLIFIHGHGGNIDGFHRQVEYFKSMGFGFLVYDQRGCGKSFMPLSRDEYKLDKYIDDLERLIDFTGIADASIVAQSSGTAVAQLFASIHPDSVEGLVLISPVFNLKQNLKESIYGRALLHGRPLIEIMTRIIEDKIPKIEGSSGGSDAPDSTSGTGIGSGTKFYFSVSKRYRKALRVRLKSMVDWDVEKAAGMIDKPVLLIHGRDDGLIDPTVSRQLNEIITGSELEVIDGDHELQEGNYSEVNSRMDNFFQRRVYNHRTSEGVV